MDINIPTSLYYERGDRAMNGEPGCDAIRVFVSKASQQSANAEQLAKFAIGNTPGID
jgi:hypothetical protein